MSTYIPSADVRDRPENGYCLLYLAILAGTLTVMITILQLCTGSCVKKVLYTSKGPTYKRGNKNNQDRKPLMPALGNLRM